MAHEPMLESTEGNKESITLIWFDPKIGSREETEMTKQQLREINDYVIFYTDLELCVNDIQSIKNEKILLITSGKQASDILPQISNLRQIDSIFIFCMKTERYQNLTNEYPKIIGVHTNLNELCTSIREQVDLVEKQLEVFSFFDHQQSTQDLSTESGAFLWFQLFKHVILRLPQNQQAKQQMIELCRHYYRGDTKQLKLIDEFERDYRPEEAIRWYTRESFVYKLVNKALRTEDTDQLHTFRFFIGDLSQSLGREHEKILSSHEEILTVYRGVQLDREEFDRLKENHGKLISTNGYLSTSRLRSPALAFAKKPSKRTNIVPVLFEIQCSIKELGKTVIFADIAKFSDYPKEEEVLFDLSATYKLESIEQDGEIQLIKMSATKDGVEITKSYIEHVQREMESWRVIIVFGILMYKLAQYDKSVKYFEQLLRDPNGEDVAWIECHLGRALAHKGEKNNARKYYDRAYHRMMKAEPARVKDSAHLLNYIGEIFSDQGKYDEALDYCQRSLKILEEYYPTGDYVMAHPLNNIGQIYSRQEKPDEAIQYHRRALEIRKKYYPDGDVNVALTLNHIGNILSRLGKYNEALDYHQQALKMREKHYPLGHKAIAESFNNIGNILSRQKKYKEALDCHQRALEMREKFYPSGHTDIGQSLRNIGLCHEYQNQLNLAVDYFQRAVTIYEKLLLGTHPYRLKIDKDIARVTAKRNTRQSNVKPWKTQHLFKK